jgi:3-dehydroquinate synthase
MNSGCISYRGNDVTEIIRVPLGTRAYPIYIGDNLLAKASQYLKDHVHGQQVLLVSDANVAPLYLQQVKESLPDKQLSEVVLPAGERYKNFASLEKIIDQLISHQHARQTTLIAVGGGVVGDMTGFAAACYQRGVNFIQIPTTLLAQVDASVGGKTGINHSRAKNMIGAFHQPQCVLVDTQTLNTLPARELSAGLAEVIKYGLIADYKFFAWLEQNISLLMARQPAALSCGISRCCQLKADIVAQDEKEQGIRAIFNLGHTFGHAIEAYGDYSRWLHGEAVAIGIVLAAQLSAKQGLITPAEVKRITDLLAAADLPVVKPADMSVDDFLNVMALDKKNRDQQLHLVLLKSLGEAFLTADIDQQLLRTVLT